MSIDTLALILLTICTGATTLAYRKPAEYRRLGKPLAMLAIVAGLSLTCWSFAVDYIGSILLPLIADNKRGVALDRLSALRPSLWAAAVALCLSAYNAFLIWLPNILGKLDD